ncbi:MAG: LacI family DNA-binding transcriptional regulator [Saprospiraceae bacterium]
MKRVTIKDLASELNTTTSTISRALRGHNTISEAMIAKVKELALERNYSINRSAANLRSGNSKVIGVIVPRINRDFFSNCIAGIEQITKASGYYIHIAQSHDDIKDEKEIIKSMVEANVCAILMSIGLQTSDKSHLDALNSYGIPLVFFDRALNDEKYNKVVIDDFRGGYMATKHLIDMGYKSIAHFTGSQNLEIYKNRTKGYLSALNDHGIIPNRDWIEEECLTKDLGASALKKMMSLPNPPDALFSSSDYSALGALLFLRTQNINVPEQFGVVGFSNEVFTSLVSPSMSTIDQHSLDIGRNAALACINIMQNTNAVRTVSNIVIEPTLIIRESSNKLKPSTKEEKPKS